MRTIGILVILSFFSCGAWSQDERYFRQLFSGELIKKDESVSAKKYSYFVHTPFYAIDLNRDQKPENLVFVKKDNEDWLDILDSNEEKIFSYQLENRGYGSELYKIELKSLSSTSAALLLYYYEGQTKYIEFQSSSRLHVVTIDNNDLKTLKGINLTSFYEEFKSLKNHYHRKHYNVTLEDLNADKIKEVVIKNRGISSVYIYKGNGMWQSFKN